MSARKRFAAAIGALAIGVTAIVGGASAASASTADINPSTPGSLTIHKHASGPGNNQAPNNGTQLTPAQVAQMGAPLSGVDFTVQRVAYNGVAINLDTPDGWTQAAGATLTNLNTAPYSLIDAQTKPTTSGVAGFTGLAHGLYYVTEGDDHGNNGIITKAQPFLVTVPYPGAGSTWNYAVHAYPKNVTGAEPTKTVKDPAPMLAIGDTVVWTITAPVPGYEAFGKFEIEDVLDWRLAVDTAGIGITLDGVTLTPGTDYTLSPAPGTEVRSSKATPVKVVVHFEPAGLAKLPGKGKVVMTLPTVVRELATDNGIIPNTATQIDNDGKVGSADRKKPTPEVEVHYGGLRLTKVADGSGATLAGAEFELWSVDGSGNPQTKVGGTFTTNPSGIIEIPDIWVGDGTVNSRNYVLVETKAPAGYALPANPRTPVTITTGGTANLLAVTITNKQKTGPELPLTGSTGTVALLGLGVLLAAAGTTTAVIGRRRKTRA